MLDAGILNTSYSSMGVSIVSLLTEHKVIYNPVGGGYLVINPYQRNHEGGI